VIDGTDKPMPSEAFELLRLFGLLLLAALFASVCALAPFFATVWLHPWAGVLVGVGSIWVWSRFGVRPMPGLLSGVLCGCGYAAILGSLSACFLAAIR
jgi:hypothetical protein